MIRSSLFRSLVLAVLAIGLVFGFGTWRPAHSGSGYANAAPQLQASELMPGVELLAAAHVAEFAPDTLIPPNYNETADTATAFAPLTAFAPRVAQPAMPVTLPAVTVVTRRGMRQPYLLNGLGMYLGTISGHLSRLRSG